MKVRIGFVSNSSSSSFIAIIEKDEYNKHLASTDKYTSAVLNKIPTNTHKFLGKDIITMNIDTTDGMFEWMKVQEKAPMVDKNHEAYEHIDVGVDDDGEDRPLTPEYVFKQFINGISEEFRISYTIAT